MSQREPRPPVAGGVCTLLTALGGYAAWRGGLPPAAAGLAAVNTVTVGAYAWDKACARRGVRRIPERVLHLLALAGGSPGALLGQCLLRHKTAKTSFQRVFWATVALQLAGVVAWVLLASAGS